MRKKKTSLAIVEKAYRGGIEEQYGHIVWLSTVMRDMGNQHDLLLRGDAVTLATVGQPFQELNIGTTRVSNLPHYETTLSRLKELGSSIYAYAPDLDRFGLLDRTMAEVVPVNSAEVAALCDEHDHVWYW